MQMNSFYVTNWGTKIIVGGISLKNIFIGYKNEDSDAITPTVCVHFCQGIEET